jgi:glyoxylase-like metal-dependent hydrolase (beta-lactamase superfamily II)
MLISLSSSIRVVAPRIPRYPYGNCVYIEDDRPTIIDFGAGETAFADVPREGIELGLISHFHFDHIHSRGFFPNAALMAGEEEKTTYTDQNEYIHFHGYDLWDELMQRKREMYGDVVKLPQDVPIEPGFKVINLAGTFSDGDIIETGKYKIRAIHLPGHSAGHYGFYFEKDNILFSADIDLVKSGPWYNSNSGSVGDLIASVQKIREIDPRIVIPSHRRIQYENISSQLDDYINVVLDREKKIYDYLRLPHTIDQLAAYRLTYPQQRDQYEEFWEKMTIRNHLIHLLELGAIAEIEPGVYRQA